MKPSTFAGWLVVLFLAYKLGIFNFIINFMNRLSGGDDND